MAAPTEVLKIGTLSAAGILMRADITVRDDGFDDGYLTYLTSARNTYVPNQATDDFPSMTIREVKSTPSPGDEFELTLRVQGLSTGTSRMIASSFTENAEGFDQGSETWIARTNSVPKPLNSSATSYSNMICVAVEKEIQQFGNPPWARFTSRFMGIMGLKNYKRRITVDGNTVSHDSLIVNLPGGWTTARKSTVDFPRVVVEDAYLQTYRPDSALANLPGNATPPNAPPVRVIASSGSELTYHWPSGWKLASVGWDEIPGTSIGIATFRYEYVLSPTLG